MFGRRNLLMDRKKVFWGESDMCFHEESDTIFMSYCPLRAWHWKNKTLDTDVFFVQDHLQLPFLSFLCLWMFSQEAQILYHFVLWTTQMFLASMMFEKHNVRRQVIVLMKIILNIYDNDIWQVLYAIRYLNATWLFVQLLCIRKSSVSYVAMRWRQKTYRF